jgi:nitrate reductase gamma subunit
MAIAQGQKKTMRFWRALLKRLLGSTIESAFSSLKIRAAIVYLNIIKRTRLLAMLICLLVLSVVVLACGFLLIPIALCLFMPWPVETKALVAALFGAAYIIVPVIAVMVLFSQRRWMKVTRADKLLKEALKK